MIYIWLNLPAILIAAAAGLAAGTAWQRLLGHAPRPRLFPGHFAASAWLAAILAGALILAPARAGVWVMTLGTAFIIWIGFVAPATLVTLTGRGTRLRTALGACGYWLTVMLVQAAMLRLVGLVPPPHG